jgi:hypothetical protein
MSSLDAAEFEGTAAVCTAGRDGRVVILDPRTGGRVGEVTSRKFSISFF